MAGAAVARRRALATYVIAAAVCFPAFWLVAVAAISSSRAQSPAQSPTAEPSAPPAGLSSDAIEAIVRNYLNKHPEQIEQIVRDYIVRHPEVLRDAITGLIKSRNSATRRQDRPRSGATQRRCSIPRVRSP